MQDKITVIIPAQKFDEGKYMGCGQKCYLNEALEKIGINAMVLGHGKTIINDCVYKPLDIFNSDVVEEYFSENKDITVTLIKQ